MKSMSGFGGGVASLSMKTTESAGGGASFNHQNASSITGTFGGYSRVSTYCNAPSDLASGIGYGTQNSNPFNTSTDWNNEIVRAYGNQGSGQPSGNYAGRTFAPVIPVLMERPPQNGNYPYSNDWESAWWIDGSGNDDYDILIVVFNTVKTITGIRFQNASQSYNNNGAGSYYAAALTGTASSFVQYPLGSVNWANPGNNARDITINYSTQAVALWLEGCTNWSRCESIRFLK